MVRALTHNSKIKYINSNQEGMLKEERVIDTKILTTCFQYDVGEKLYIPTPLLESVLKNILSAEEYMKHISKEELYKTDFYDAEILECIGNYGYGTEITYKCKVTQDGLPLMYNSGEPTELLVQEGYLLNESQVNSYKQMDKICYVHESYYGLLKDRYGMVNPISEETRCLKLMTKVASWGDFIMEEVEVPKTIEGILSNGQLLKGDINAIITIKAKDGVKVLMRVTYKGEDGTILPIDYTISY